MGTVLPPDWSDGQKELSWGSCFLLHVPAGAPQPSCPQKPLLSPRQGAESVASPARQEPQPPPC